MSEVFEGNTSISQKYAVQRGVIYYEVYFNCITEKGSAGVLRLLITGTVGMTTLHYRRRTGQRHGREAGPSLVGLGGGGGGGGGGEVHNGQLATKMLEANSVHFCASEWF